MATKLPKPERHVQLLDTAMDILREKGADELTLGSLAERAGVSRPVAYEHFATRTGLLVTLHQQLEASYMEALRATLVDQDLADLATISRRMSEAYFHCQAEMGAEGSALAAALQGSAEMAKHQRAALDGYIDIMSMALRPHSRLGEQAMRLRCAALLGAADALGRERLAGRATLSEVVTALAALIETAVGFDAMR